LTSVHADAVVIGHGELTGAPSSTTPSPDVSGPGTAPGEDYDFDARFPPFTSSTSSVTTGSPSRQAAGLHCCEFWAGSLLFSHAYRQKPARRSFIGSTASSKSGDTLSSNSPTTTVS
jgi:hypothetical protein